MPPLPSVAPVPAPDLLRVGVQWALFVWAPLSGKVIDLSLGYFLLPLAMVLVGRVFYGERLRPLQKLSVAMALLGVVHELWMTQAFSWVTLLAALGYPPYFMLRRWMRELTAAPTAAFPGNGQMRADLAEIAALKKEVARLRAERDILKKAAAFFAREAT